MYRGDNLWHDSGFKTPLRIYHSVPWPTTKQINKFKKWESQKLYTMKVIIFWKFTSFWYRLDSTQTKPNITSKLRSRIFRHGFPKFSRVRALRIIWILLKGKNQAVSVMPNFASVLCSVSSISSFVLDYPSFIIFLIRI